MLNICVLDVSVRCYRVASVSPSRKLSARIRPLNSPCHTLHALDSSRLSV